MTSNATDFRVRLAWPAALAALVFLVAGCTDQPAAESSADTSLASLASTAAPISTSSIPATSTTPTSSSTSTVEVSPVRESGPSLAELDWKISFNSIGPVRVGSTKEEIEAALGPGFEISHVDVLGEALSGHSVAVDGEILLHFATYEPDNPVFEVLITASPRFSLASGLRSGMDLAEATELHGEPKFWFHAASHGREWVAFADGTGDSGETIHITSVGVESLQAGIYGEPSPEDPQFFETTEFDPDGTIGTITVNCFGPGRQSCS